MRMRSANVQKVTVKTDLGVDSHTFIVLLAFNKSTYPCLNEGRAIRTVSFNGVGGMLQQLVSDAG